MNPKTKFYHFVLVLTGWSEPHESIEDALFEAGCDDALLIFRNQVPYLEFDRPAETLEEAILSAIQAVEATHLGARVLRVEPNPFVGISDIARRAQLSLEQVERLMTGPDQGAKSPTPVFELDGKCPVWKWAEVANWLWFHHYLNDVSLVEVAIVIENINATLEWRNPEVSYRRAQIWEKLVPSQLGVRN